MDSVRKLDLPPLEQSTVFLEFVDSTQLLRGDLVNFANDTGRPGFDHRRESVELDEPVACGCLGGTETNRVREVACVLLSAEQGAVGKKAEFFRHGASVALPSSSFKLRPIGGRMRLAGSIAGSPELAFAQGIFEPGAEFNIVELGAADFRIEGG